ncbi:MAG: DNA translocase FtsK 4TM domain-containing protein, partial [Hydrogenophaga sp.]|nr:DNA translocase FtsK 4TM domain-containing protein [Hydrogenophaga sp.]
MTYSLNTLNADRDSASPGGLLRFAHELALVGGALFLGFWLIALFSHSLADPAWSTTGQQSAIGNWGGQLGAWLADLSYYLFGFSVWWLVLAALRVWLSALAERLRGSSLVQAKDENAQREYAWWQSSVFRRLAYSLALVVLLTASVTLEWSRLYRFEPFLPGEGGGVLGQMLGPLASRWLGFTGSALASLALMVVCAPKVFGFAWGHWAERLGAQFDDWFQSRREKREAVEDQRIGEQAAREREVVVQVEREVSEEQHPTPVVIEASPVAVPKSERVAKERQKPLFVEMPDSKLPQVDLLDSAPGQQSTVDAQTLEMTSRLIEKKLKDFGVEVRVVAAAPGPVITRYEIEPATGVKGSQIVNLSRDLARSLSLVSIRVIETIPGKNLMALELPNAKRQTIKLSEILGSQVYNDARSLLTMGLGKDIAGLPVVADLAKMPHCLVAGTTGSGKSVGINAMILSLLYKADAKDVRLLLIDPKMLELSVYEGIPHLLCPVVTDMKQAANGLNWCVAEMEKRYKLMSKMGVRNLAGFNTKIDEAKARGESIGNPFSLTPEQPEPLERLPHIVVVIDELADLMMVVGKKIEELIA